MSPKAERDSESGQPHGWWYHSFLPVRKAIVRGLAIIMPPLLTIVVFLWALNIIDSYVLIPVEATARQLIVWSIADIRDNRSVQQVKEGRFLSANEWVAPDGVEYTRVNMSWIPQNVYNLVESDPGPDRPDTPDEYYSRYVTLEYLPRELVIPAFLAVFILVLYLLGRLFAFGIGRMVWNYLESVIHRLPLISKVYSSVKQVTDFAFSESEIQFTRVVAVEYPRRGVWSMGFVTGESFLTIRNAAKEPVISVLMPTSPMPATGFVISVPRSQTVDLDISIDQAIQFCVSCGVVVPPHQQGRPVSDHTVTAAASALLEDGKLRTAEPNEEPPAD